ncbi:hypothetical protein Zmor_017509 [Zophobas morio]|uniref:Uncharacterized protein n=1 Tax=Zophobas morio TaxID=2755281 RepID=A0AA38MCV9_9CUCU|nr:hypothetical protein Zmor_017509 [Zophobas morio]
MVEKKIHVTRSSLLDCLKKKHIFEGSLSSLGRILHSLLGFVILQQVYESVLWNYMLFMQKHTSYVNTCTISRTQILCHLGPWQDDSVKSIRTFKIEGKNILYSISDPQLLKTELHHLVAQNKHPKTYVAVNWANRMAIEYCVCRHIIVCLTL